MGRRKSKRIQIRNQEIIRLIKSGKTTKYIAERYGLTQSTVSDIFQKTGYTITEYRNR